MTIPKRVQAKLKYSETKPASMCTCGHTGDGAKSAHAGPLGHGSCTAGTPTTGVRCPCMKFTWRSWTGDYERFMKHNR